MRNTALAFLILLAPGLSLGTEEMPPDPAAGLPRPAWMDYDDADLSAEMGEEAQQEESAQNVGSHSSGSYQEGFRKGIEFSAQALLLQEAAKSFSKSLERAKENPLKRSSRENLVYDAHKGGIANELVHQALQSGQYNNTQYRAMYSNVSDTILGEFSNTPDSAPKEAINLEQKTAPPQQVPSLNSELTPSKAFVVFNINSPTGESLPVEVDQQVFEPTEFSSNPLGLDIKIQHFGKLVSKKSGKLDKQENRGAPQETVSMNNSPKKTLSGSKPLIEKTTPNGKTKQLAQVSQTLAGLSTLEMGELDVEGEYAAPQQPFRLLAGELLTATGRSHSLTTPSKKVRPSSRETLKLAAFSELGSPSSKRISYALGLLLVLLLSLGFILRKKSQHS